jgi:hypothetical protein
MQANAVLRAEPDILMIKPELRGLVFQVAVREEDLTLDEAIERIAGKAHEETPGNEDAQDYQKKPVGHSKRS